MLGCYLVHYLARLHGWGDHCWNCCIPRIFQRAGGRFEEFHTNLNVQGQVQKHQARGGRIQYPSWQETFTLRSFIVTSPLSKRRSRKGHCSRWEETCSGNCVFLLGVLSLCCFLFFIFTHDTPYNTSEFVYSSKETFLHSSRLVSKSWLSLRDVNPAFSPLTKRVREQNHFHQNRHISKAFSTSDFLTAGPSPIQIARKARYSRNRCLSNTTSRPSEPHSPSRPMTSLL